jgi:UPF0755 protein
MSLPSRDSSSRNGRSIFSVIARLFAILVAFAVLAGATGVAGWVIATADGPLAEDKVVNIEKGSTSEQIGQTLVDQGVVDSGTLATLGITVLRRFFDLEPKAGEYEFTARSSLADVLRKIKRGQIVTYKVSIPEGFTTWQVLERLKANDVLAGEIETVPAEGELLPDTYVFTRGRTRQSLIDQMKAARQELVDRLWEGRKEGLPFKSPEEAIILASIVEKETGKAEERAQVAGVFINRLKNGMRLQSDPTIIYGITQGQGKLERPVYRSDIRQRTDYNTYQIDGLPPTPIANPGRASIEAVLNPIDTDYIYFVADGSGGHAFAVTLDQHNQNVKKWRSWLKDQRELREEQETREDLRASLDSSTNAAAPLPTGNEAEPAPAATGGVTPAPSASTEEAAAEPASSFEIVQVSGRHVPIPRSKPTRQ